MCKNYVVHLKFVAWAIYIRRPNVWPEQQYIFVLNFAKITYNSIIYIQLAIFELQYENKECMDVKMFCEIRVKSTSKLISKETNLSAHEHTHAPVPKPLKHVGICDTIIFSIPIV